MNFGKKQLIMLSLVVLIIAAGYLQYNYNQGSNDLAQRKIGDAVFVENSKKPVKSATESQSEPAVTASQQANEYFSQAKLDKETIRSKDVDDLEKIVSDHNATKDVIKKAYEAKMKLVQVAEREMNIENLIKKIGFADVLAVFSDDGSVDIVLKAPSINSAQTAQITDIVSRYANISDFEKIHVKSIF